MESRAAVDNGGSLGAVGGVLSDGLSDGVGSDGTSGQGENSSDGETHVDGVKGFFCFDESFDTQV